MYHVSQRGSIMKKILIIMILATTFIPMSRTGISLGEMNLQNKQKAKEIQTVVKHESKEIRTATHKKLFQSKIQRKEARIGKISQNNAKLKIPSEKKDRLFGLLLLAYGGQR